MEFIIPDKSKYTKSIFGYGGVRKTNFTQVKYIVNSNITYSYTVIPKYCMFSINNDIDATGTIKRGSSIKLIITPNDGYYLNNLSIDGYCVYNSFITGISATYEQIIILNNVKSDIIININCEYLSTDIHETITSLASRIYTLENTTNTKLNLISTDIDKLKEYIDNEIENNIYIYDDTEIKSSIKELNNSIITINEVNDAQSKKIDVNTKINANQESKIIDIIENHVETHDEDTDFWKEY